MTGVKLMALALATVSLANVTAVGIYLANESSAEERVIAETLTIPEDEKEQYINPASSGYTKTPYSEQYAVGACEERADTRFGSKLVHRHVIDLSTRYDNYSETFVIVLFAHLGTLENYTEVKVYCHIDPKTYVINYFKEYPA